MYTYRSVGPPLKDIFIGHKIGLGLHFFYTNISFSNWPEQFALSLESEWIKEDEEKNY